MNKPRRIGSALATAASLLAVAAPGATAAPGDLPSTCERVTPETIENQVLDHTVQVVSAGNAVITASLFIPRQATQYNPAAAVLMTHGGGGSRFGLRPTTSGNLTQSLLDAGFAVLAYDSRGHGDSRQDTAGGPVTYDFGGRDGVQDVRSLVTGLLARCRAVSQEAPGDPVVGFVGASNGGGIQLNAAASVSELDAIVPMLSWGNLADDLAPNDVPKAYGELISETFRRGRVNIDPALERFRDGVSGGLLQPDVRDWLEDRSTSASVGAVRIPTLLLQGTLDTLFPLQGAMKNFERIRANGAPVKLVTFCTGHNADATPPRSCRSGTDMNDITFRWLNHYLRGAEANLGGPIEWYGPDGRFRSAGEIGEASTVVTVPKATKKKRRATRKGRRGGTRPRRSKPTPPLGVLGGPGSTGGDTQTYASPAPTSEAASTLRVRLADRNRHGCRALFGIPRVTIVGSVAGPEGFLFAELQESNTNGERRTVNLNTMPVRLARGRFRAAFPLHGVSWVLGTGNYLDLELTTGSDMYAEPRRNFRVTVERVEARVPLGPAGRGRSC